jgi:Na+-translocating ferredoxin:NAD+ oxidoreductase RnfD subunit
MLKHLRWIVPLALLVTVVALALAITPALLAANPNIFLWPM